MTPILQFPFWELWGEVFRYFFVTFWDPFRIFLALCFLSRRKCLIGGVSRGADLAQNGADLAENGARW